MDQSPKKTVIGPQFGLDVKTLKCKPHELIKINVNDLTDTFLRKLNHVSPMLRNSMGRAYKQALTDAQYLLMASEKDTRSEAA